MQESLVSTAKSASGAMKSSPGTSPAAPQPAPLSEQVSNQMKRMRRASTKPELLIRRALHRRGLRFRVNHPALPGRPDIAFTRVRLAIFIDGCFWHMCPKHGVMPKNNREWWQAKLHRNVERDREKDAALMDLGWHVRHFWEHDDPAAAAEEIEKAWQHLRTSPEPDS